MNETAHQTMIPLWYALLVFSILENLEEPIFSQVLVETRI